MPDREKVIKGLKCCKPTWFTVTNCADEYCPYNCYGHNETTGCVDHLIDDALELLKGQEQKTVKPIANGDDSWVCENCGETIGWEELNCGGCEKVKYKFCPSCGRKVKWDD